MNIQQVANLVVAESLDMEYVQDCGVTTVGAVYKSESGYNGLNPVACKDYLQGLPSVCTVPFYNSEILELLAKHGITRKTDNGNCGLIEQYWAACGKALYAHIIKENNSK